MAMLLILPSDLGPVGAIPVIGPVLAVGLAIVSVLGSIFGFGSGPDYSKAISALQNQLATVTQTLTRFTWAIGYVVGLIMQWIHDLLVGWMQTIWNLLKKIASILKSVVTDLIPRLLRIIKNLRAWLQTIYTKYIRPVLAWIQYLRRWLAILKLFHIGWASKLDSWLVRLQGRIIAPYLYVLRTINGIGTWVNLVVSAEGLIQRPVFINTMYAYQADWISMWWTGQTPIAAPGVAPPPPPPFVPPTPPEVTAQLQQFVARAGGPISDAVTRSLAAGQGVNPQLTVVT